MTKVLMLRFECGRMTRTALENSENYHVSGVASGSFHAVSTVCLPAPNVERRGSELHLFHQRPDHRLHITKRVYCQAIGLRVTTCPLFCRIFDVVRLLSRKSTASTACHLRETVRARRLPRATDWVRHAFPRKSSGLDPFVCLWALSEKRWHLPSLGQGCVTPFHGPMWPLSKPAHANVRCSCSVTDLEPPATQGWHGGRNGTESDCELLSHRRSVRSALRCAVTTSCSSCSFTTSTPSSSCITLGTSRAAVPVWRSKMCKSTSCTLLRRVRFIGQADGWWSRVDALDPGRELLSTQRRPSRKQKNNASRRCQWHSCRRHLAIGQRLCFSSPRHVYCRLSQSSNKRSQVCVV